MIKNDMQRTMKIKEQISRSTKSPLSNHLLLLKQRAFQAILQSRKQGISPYVLDIADSMIKQYKSDLDYLKDR